MRLTTPSIPRARLAKARSSVNVVYSASCRSLRWGRNELCMNEEVPDVSSERERGKEKRKKRFKSEVCNRNHAVQILGRQTPWTRNV